MNDSLLPVEVVFNRILVKVVKADYLKELLVVDHSVVVFVHHSEELLKDGRRHRDDLLHAAKELGIAYIIVFISVEQGPKVLILHPLEGKGVSDLLTDFESLLA